MGWFKRRIRKWLGIDKDHESCQRQASAVIDRAERLMALVNGAADLHVASPMRNWAVFVVKGKDHASDLVNIVDLSHMDYSELRRFIKHIDLDGSRMRIDAPPGVKQHVLW